MVQNQFCMVFLTQLIIVDIERVQLNISFTFVTLPLTEEYTQEAQEIIGQKVVLAESK
jgi:hypothetical protein